MCEGAQAEQKPGARTVVQEAPPVSRLCGPVRPLPVCGKERTCPRRSGAQRGPGLRVWRMLVLEAWFRIPPCVKGPGLVRWLISLDCNHPQKGGSESEPSRGRLQPSRRAERALLRKRRGKGAGGIWHGQMPLHQKTKAPFGALFFWCAKRDSNPRPFGS